MGQKRYMTTIFSRITQQNMSHAQGRQNRLRSMMNAASKPTSRPTNEHVFQLKLEAHLHDVKMRKPWRTPGVHTELRQRHVDNRDVLAGIDPTAMRMYMGLITGMEYRQQARLASSVFHMSKHLEALSTVNEQLAAIRPTTQADMAQVSLPNTRL